ncbi:hypothetical protein [Ureibacillus sp. GCM10028918]|uniref:hypothetical protein n=1 Tax=Ureibacillus sp. GCM10028918 TaxID=3273429 RepID=UPI003619CCC1
MYIIFAATMILLSGVTLFFWTLNQLNLEIHKKESYVKETYNPSFEQIIIFAIINRVLNVLPLKLTKGILIIVSFGLILLSLFWFLLLL